MHERRREMPVQPEPWQTQLALLRERLPAGEYTQPFEGLKLEARALDSWLKADIVRGLFELGVPLNWDDVEILPNQTVAIYIKTPFSEKQLPVGVVYKGGAARELLKRALGMPVISEPRDIDLAYIGETPLTLEQELSIAEYMHVEDLEHSSTGFHLVEPVGANYFKNRDFTINECYATDTKVVCTVDCLFDTARHIIRATPYEIGFGRVKPKTVAKATRFWCETIHPFNEAAIMGIPDWQFEDMFKYTFALLLNLDKAMQNGPDVAQRYVDELNRWGCFKDVSIRTPDEALAYLLTFMEEDYRFRYAPQEQFIAEEKLSKRMDVSA